MNYLMVRNIGTTDYRALTVLGVSTTRSEHNKNTGLIGKFGSGTKQSVALLLRHGIRPIIYSGNLCMESFIAPEIISGQTFNRIKVKYSGQTEDGKTKNTTEDLGFVAEYGAEDWTQLAMAYREFVSNAIDASITNGLSYSNVEFAIVEKPRAKKGCTSVFIPYTAEIEQVHMQLGKMFLHFSTPEQLGNKLIPKRNASQDLIYVYKRGVLVNQLKGKSLFDYNFGDELDLDECRNARDSDVREKAAYAIRDASVSDIATVLRGVMQNADIFESAKLYNYDLTSIYCSKEVAETRKKKFQAAWDMVAGDKAVMSTLPSMEGFIRNKGFTPVHMNSNTWFRALESYGILSETAILDDMERKEHVPAEVTPAQQEALDWAWNLVVTFGMHNNQKKPELRSYRPLREGGSQQLGCCDMTNGIIWLHAELGGADLKKTALHEMVHHCTKAEDCSTDYQDFLLRLTTLIAG